MKHSLHGRAEVRVVLVQWSGVLCLSRRPEVLSSGQQRSDCLAAQHNQRSKGSQSLGDHFVAMRFANPSDDVLAAQFFQIVGGR